jgi:hypothetical protein
MVEEPLGVWDAPDAFRESALRHFQFLVDSGLAVTDESATPFVTFTSPTHEISIFFSAEHRHELDVSIATPPKTPQPHRVDGLQQAAGFPSVPSSDFDLRMPTTPSLLDAALAVRAAQVRQLLAL